VLEGMVLDVDMVNKMVSASVDGVALEVVDVDAGP
jgi:hypothetical protein